MPLHDQGVLEDQDLEVVLRDPGQVHRDLHGGPRLAHIRVRDPPPWTEQHSLLGEEDRVRPQNGRCPATSV